MEETKDVCGSAREGERRKKYLCGQPGENCGRALEGSGNTSFGRLCRIPVKQKFSFLNRCYLINATYCLVIRFWTVYKLSMFLL